MKDEIIEISRARVPFLPTLDEWVGMYGMWLDKMAKSLWSFGSFEDCREAVHEAFLKAMGLSDHLHLRDELTPKVEGCWYGFIRNQAKGILSHRNNYAKRFEPIKEYCLAEETLDEEDWGDVDDSDALKTTASECESDVAWLRRELRKTVKDVCHDAGVNAAHVAAFVRFMLDDKSGDEVVAEFPSVKSANNLYQITNRIMRRLKASAARFRDLREELKAA